MKFGRLITAMVTPFTSELELDLDQVGELAHELITTKQSDALVVSGTTGESPTLTKSEKVKLFNEVVKTVGKKTQVIAGTGSYSTEESIELTKQAEQIGVDGIMLVTPYYNKPTQEGMFYHFTSIAEQTSLPIMLYNVPSRTGVDLSLETSLRLAEYPNIIALKEASGDFNKITDIIKDAPPDFHVYSGDDVSLMPVLSVGGEGVVSVASHLVGDKIKKVIINYEQGKQKKALDIYQKIFPLFRGLTIKTNPIPIKNMVDMNVTSVGGLRPPLVSLTQDELNKIVEMYKNIEN